MSLSSALIAKKPLAIHQHSLGVVAGVNHRVTRASAPHFQQPVSVTRTRLEASAHARRQAGAALIGVQSRVAFEDIDEFVVCGVRIAQGRNRIT